MDFFLARSKKGTELFNYAFISIKASPRHPLAAPMCCVISRLAASRGLSRSGGCLLATGMGTCAPQSPSPMRRGSLLSAGADSPRFPGQDPSPWSAAVCAAPAPSPDPQPGSTRLMQAGEGSHNQAFKIDV